MPSNVSINTLVIDSKVVFVDGTGNPSIEINNCPFCGEKFIDEHKCKEGRPSSVKVEKICGLWYFSGVVIKYCPFCNEELK